MDSIRRQTELSANHRWRSVTVTYIREPSPAGSGGVRSRQPTFTRDAFLIGGSRRWTNTTKKRRVKSVSAEKLRPRQTRRPPHDKNRTPAVGRREHGWCE